MATFSFGHTTIMMLLFFGVNAILYVLFQLVHNNKDNDGKSNEDKKDLVEKAHAPKELSKPFTGTVTCFTNITSELFRTGLIMALTYICENHWFFDHSGKTYSRDLFMFVLILFFAYAFYTIKPVHDLTLLSREQTEEWKGWMQFIFLLYHYFHAEEVYNSVRCMITCYVWMTGFGNFQFFYVKKDFGWLRVAQMLWRLNFSVMLLMWTHGNTWILYYICPMHTFYFFLVYATMAVMSNINHSKWGIRIKLFVVGVIIFMIWDYNHGIFDIVFAFLGTKSVIGANNGSVWEYYFRTSLDHWSSFLGMIFAINFPLSEQYFHRAKGWPLIVSGTVMGALTIWWVVYIYTLEKLTYNLYHAYYAIIPLTSYIFFRNITPAIRSGVSMSLHDLGKTTLETYLLQHHVWLTSNAKTLLTIVPGHPWINFALATMLFFFLAKELYRLTMSLRGMIVPDDGSIAAINMAGLFGIFGVCYAVGYILHLVEANLLVILLVTAAMGIVAIAVISFFARQTSENLAFQHWSKSLMSMLSAALVIGMIVQFTMGPAMDFYLGMAPDTISSWSDTKYIGDSPACLNSVHQGYWETIPCEGVPAPQLDRHAFCETEQWTWTGYSNTCPVAVIPSAKAKTVFKSKNVVFMGDSIVRNSYHQFNKLLNPSYDENTLINTTYKHASLKYSSGSTQVAFVWAPMVKNITDSLANMQRNEVKVDLLVTGATLWDALYSKNNIKLYRQNLARLSEVLPDMEKTIKIWLQPTTVLDGRLNTPDKQRYMNEDTIDAYRNAVVSAPGFGDLYDVILDTTTVSESRASSCADGVHYGDEVYSVIAQMVSNVYSLHFPQFYSSKTPVKFGPPKTSGAMSFPMYGLAMLIISAIMLVTFDGFLGIGIFSLALFGRSYDWESAFEPIHKKLGIKMDHRSESEGLLREEGIQLNDK